MGRVRGAGDTVQLGLHAVGIWQVLPRVEAQPSSVFPGGLSRQGDLCRTGLLQWSTTLPNRNKRATSSCAALLKLTGGREGSRKGRWGKKGARAAFSLHSAFPKLREKGAPVTSCKVTTEGAIIMTIATFSNQVVCTTG